VDRAADVEQEQERTAGFIRFVSEAASIVLRRPMLVPALLLLVVLTGSNIVILLNLPTEKGSLPPWPFLIAAFVRIGGVLVLSSAILRIGAPSERPPWRLDAGFLLYSVAILASLGLALGAASLLGNPTDPAGLALRSAISTIVMAPFAPWIVGMNVAKPLGWNPTRFMRAFRRWLPPLLLWSLLLITPMGVLHAMIDVRLIAGVGELFWPLALFDGALSTVLALTGFALNLAAYRRVAPD
jgi:hypothetical protein